MLDRFTTARAADFDEQSLRDQIAYFKARLADIDKAPRGSQHRAGRDWVSRQLQECQRLLERMQHC